VLRVQKIGDDCGVVFPREALAALRLAEGVEVEVRPLANEVNGAHTNKVRYVTVGEALEAYRETLPQHREAYLELAK